jgi:hypothetical protein
MSIQENNIEQYHRDYVLQNFKVFFEVRAHLNNPSARASKHTHPQTSNWLLYNAKKLREIIVLGDLNINIV